MIDRIAHTGLGCRVDNVFELIFSKQTQQCFFVDHIQQLELEIAAVDVNEFRKHNGGVSTGNTTSVNILATHPTTRFYQADIVVTNNGHFHKSLCLFARLFCTCGGL
ncbi:hypothetical protein PMI27_000385 [Pseudomonas sp. GM41(2012)]|nr:hypothetical protein PMI27_000385 [Pseudomonas sp. GM41(2012)]